MFSVCVRSHVMIAHSFRGELFGPARGLHGATYVVDVEFKRPELSEEGVVVDIGLASEALAGLLAELNYKNLDELPRFSGRNTTTEFLAKHVFDVMGEAIEAGKVGTQALDVCALRVTLHESHVAWATYESQVSFRRSSGED